MAYRGDDPFRALSFLASSGFGDFKLPKSLFDQFDLVRRTGLMASIDRLSTLSATLPKAMQMPALGVSAEFARLVSGSSMLTAYAEVQQISRRITDLVQPTMGVLDAAAVAAPFQSDMLRLSERLNHTVRGLVLVELPWELERATEVSTHAWRLVVDALPSAPHGLLLDRAALAGTSTFATARAVAAVVDEDFDDEEPVPEPDSGALTLPGQLRTDLRLRLEALDPALARRLDGAWERIGIGSDAVSQACHSVQELLDWALRLSAPDAVVLEWHRATQRPEPELNKGRPTRVLRAKYLLRDRGVDAKVARLYLRSINDVVEILQAGKHDLHAPHTPHALAWVLVTVEGLLGFLLAAD